MRKRRFFLNSGVVNMYLQDKTSEDQIPWELGTLSQCPCTANDRPLGLCKETVSRFCKTVEIPIRHVSPQCIATRGNHVLCEDQSITKRDASQLEAKRRMRRIMARCWMEIISTQHLLSISTQHPYEKYCSDISGPGAYHDLPIEVKSQCQSL